MNQTPTNNQDTLPDFHAVEFMREVRTRHAEKYQADQQRYLKDARKAMEAFKQLLKSQQPLDRNREVKAGKR
jgi:hypothetical protein